MYAPSVETFHGDGKGLVRISKIQQSSDNACIPVRITFAESERIRCMVVIEFDFAWTVLVLLPLFETFKTVCRNALVNSRFSYRLNLLVGKCFFSQSRKYRNEGTCIRQDIHSNTARHGGVCSSCHRRCISRLGMSAHKWLPVSCIQPSGFFGPIR